jgi:hypothetical protein
MVGSLAQEFLAEGACDVLEARAPTLHLPQQSLRSGARPM